MWKGGVDKKRPQNGAMAACLCATSTAPLLATALPTAVPSAGCAPDAAATAFSAATRLAAVM